LRGANGDVDAIAVVLLNADVRPIEELLAAASVDLVPSSADRNGKHGVLSIAPWTVVPSRGAPSGAPDAWRIMWWSLPLSLALAVVFAWGTARSVRRPVLALTSAAEGMAGGDLDTPLPAVAEADEIGRLASVLERLRVALHRDAWRRQTLRKVITAQEEERRRIARELHDDTAQALAAVGVSLEAALDDIPVSQARWRLESLKVIVQRRSGIFTA
jgi:HAMP domain-containing protein